MQDLDKQSLPDDPEALKSLLFDFHHKLEDKDKQLAAEQQKVQLLQEQVRLLLHKRFAASSERQEHPGQQTLFDEVEVEAVEAELNDGTETMTVSSHTKKKPGRKPLPNQLPRIDVMHDLADEDKVC